MNTNPLFTAALGLAEPWQVIDVKFDAEAGENVRGELTVRLDFPRGATFPCPSCHEECKVYDTVERRWRHLDFFQHSCLLVARCPRVSCREHNVLTVPLPWEGTGRGFTALFEALVIEFCRQMPVLAVARMMRVDDTTLWKILHRHVERALAAVDLSRVKVVGVDETARARGQRYVTLFAELNEAGRSRVIFATAGRDSGVFQAFVEHLEQHGGKPEQVKEAAADMSTAFRKGIDEYLPNAEVTFDRFHVMQLATKAVDQVRRAEVKENLFLKKTRYAWLKRSSNLTPVQKELIEQPELLHTATARAYQLKETLADFFQCPRDLARKELQRLVQRMKASQIGPMIKLGQTLALWKRHILRYFTSHLTTAFMESTNSLVQAARSRARGYRSVENFITMIYLIAGKMNLNTSPFGTH